MRIQQIEQMSTFSVPTQVIFGFGSSSQVGFECKRLGISKALVVIDTGVKNAGVLQDLFTSLDDSDVPFVVFDQVDSDPDTQLFANSVDFLKKNICDGVITAGGGSAMCAGKATALLASNGGNIRDYEGIDKFRNPPLPCIAIPTTAGSGSEVSKVTVITDERTKRKMIISGFANAPKVAVLDPLLLKSLPRGQAVASGVDAMTHAIEALSSRFATPLTDAIALAAIEIFARYFCPAVLGDDLEAKSEMLFASTMANIACGNAGLGLVHALNMGITYLYKSRGYDPVPYGLIHAICLPHVLEFNLPACETKFASMAKALGVKENDVDKRKLARQGIERVKELLTSLDTPRSLPWQGVSAKELNEVSKIILDTSLASYNPRKANESEVVRLLEKALEGWIL